MSGFVDREDEVFGVLQAFKAEDLDFVVVGGVWRFCVSAQVFG
jgi:hypothetical protein